jgi:hypothetical protein
VTYTITITDHQGRTVRTYAGVPAQAMRAVVGVIDRILSLASGIADVAKGLKAIEGGRR